jgi:hypothetical protein
LKFRAANGIERRRDRRPRRCDATSREAVLTLGTSGASASCRPRRRIERPRSGTGPVSITALSALGEIIGVLSTRWPIRVCLSLFERCK